MGCCVTSTRTPRRCSQRLARRRSFSTTWAASAAKTATRIPEQTSNSRLLHVLGAGCWYRVAAGRDEGMPVFHALGINAVTLDTPDGPCLSVTWSWPDALFDRDDVERLAELWFGALQALVIHARRHGAGGHTPSDLTLPGLSLWVRSRTSRRRLRVADVWPLFPLQEGLLFHALYDQSAADVYTAQCALVLDGPLDAGLLRACAGVLLARHPGLRAGFRQVADGIAGSGGVAAGGAAMARGRLVRAGGSRPGGGAGGGAGW